MRYIGTKLAGVTPSFNRAKELEFAGVEGRFQILNKQSAEGTLWLTDAEAGPADGGLVAAQTLVVAFRS
jgi:hypothetical protein